MRPNTRFAVIDWAFRRLCSRSELRDTANCVALRGERERDDIEMAYQPDRDTYSHPRQIEKRHRPDAGEKAPHRVEIADRLGGVPFGADFKRQPDDGVLNTQAQRLIETAADTDQD